MAAEVKLNSPDWMNREVRQRAIEYALELSRTPTVATIVVTTPEDLIKSARKIAAYILGDEH